tara:strand:- start:3210 stop:3410 length:201 start_codon:yes stop_codon:yes gene_type:complete
MEKLLNLINNLNLTQKICLLIFILTPFSWEIINGLEGLTQPAEDSLFYVLLIGSFLGMFLFKTNNK